MKFKDAERFWSKVDKTEDCWQWTAARNSENGYGVFSIGGRLHVAHRVAYQAIVGPIPAGLQLDLRTSLRWHASG